MSTYNLSLPMQANQFPYFASFKRITSSDKRLLEKSVNYFRPFSKNYEDSWGYVIQATRYGGMRLYDPETNSLIFFCRKSLKDSTLVVPSFFATPEYLTQVIDRLQKKLKVQKTIVKNINSDDIDTFLKLGFRQYRENEGWYPEARFDDQTYPQQIIDLKKFTEARGKAYHNLRNALSKKPNITIRRYNDHDNNTVLKLFAIKDSHATHHLSKELKGMYYESHVMYLDSEVDRFVIVDNVNNEIVGFIATSDISSLAIASIASIFRPDAQRIRAWCTYQVLKEKYQEGFQLVNLGGSEFEGSYNFRKWTFRPVEELKKTHLVYDP